MHQNQDQFAQGPPGAGSRTGTRPRATPALTRGTTQGLMECQLAAVSIAAVKRYQANINIHHRLFFSVCLCVSIQTPLSKSGSCQYSYTPLSSRQANDLQAPPFPAAGSKVLHGTLLCVFSQGIRSSASLLIQLQFSAALGAPANACPALGIALQPQPCQTPDPPVPFFSHTIPYALFLALLLAETPSWPWG